MGDDLGVEPDTGHGGVDTAAPGPEPAPPPVVGERFELGERLGRGAAATVYRARDRLLGREVAVKLFAPGIGTLESASVRREMQATAQVVHPGVLEVFDVGEVDDRVFLVTRLVAGGSLADALERGPLPVEVVVGLAGELLAALAHVHALGIVHRDVKPGNVLLDPDALDPDALDPDPEDGADAGGPARVHPVLADFGVAAMATATTVHGQVTGTAAYLAPEQVRGESVGSPADVYALGLVLLECLTGRREYPGGPIESSVARLHRDPAVPDDLPEALRDLLTTMTAASPGDRPSASEARERLRALAGPLGLDEETLAVPAAAIASDATPAARSPIVLGVVRAGPSAATIAVASSPVAAGPAASGSVATGPAGATGTGSAALAPGGSAEPPTGPIRAASPPRARTVRRGLLVAVVAVVLAGGIVGGVALTGGSTPLAARLGLPVPATPASPPPGPAVPAATDPAADPGTVVPGAVVPGGPAADPAAPGAPGDPDGGDAPLPVAPAPAPTAPGLPPAPTPCRSVVISLAGAGATARIVFTNRGDTACTLRGVPAVRWVGAGGKVVGAPATRVGAAGPALTLAPNGSVAATLRIVPVTEFTAKNCDAVAVRGLAVRAPGTTATATLPRAGKACSGTIAKPQLAVTPVGAL